MMEEVIPLSPINFFAISFDCAHFDGRKGEKLGSKYLLPNLFSHFYEERPFGEVFLGWNESGLFCTLQTHASFDHAHFPDYRAGDSLELFIDTRDVKGSFSRFCHHFCILPVPIETNGDSLMAFEISKFRGEDNHPLADPHLITVENEKKRTLRIFLPREVLYGYDPAQFNRLGFTYRINRLSGLPQYFSAMGEEVAIEGAPASWASVNLIK